MADFFSGPRDSTRQHGFERDRRHFSYLLARVCGRECEENQRTEQLVVVAVGQREPRNIHRLGLQQRVRWRTNGVYVDDIACITEQLRTIIPTKL